MKKSDLIKLAVDPYNNENWNKPLWCVHGYDSHPSIHCLRIHDLAVWGYSVYRREPGFRTLGVSLAKFHENKDLHLYFEDIEVALSYLRLVLTPKL